MEQRGLIGGLPSGISLLPLKCLGRWILKDGGQSRTQVVNREGKSCGKSWTHDYICALF